jgi:hypothetical protein
MTAFIKPSAKIEKLNWPLLGVIPPLDQEASPATLNNIGIQAV